MPQHAHRILSLQEGPHSALNEDEFFDALEMAYQQDEMVSESMAVKLHDKVLFNL